MPWSLYRFHESGDLHFVTASCYKRLPLLSRDSSRLEFVRCLEHARGWYKMAVLGYVVMPEHVHLLVAEPERAKLALVMQMLKQTVARNLRATHAQPSFWYERYFDFNVRTQEKMVEKLRYMHRNPVTRGLCARPEDWRWSSFRHYATGEESIVEVESQWTGRRREAEGNAPKLRFVGVPAESTIACRDKDEAPEYEI